MTSNPALLLMLGSVAVPLLRGWPRRALMAALPIVALVVLWLLDEGSGTTFELFGMVLNPLRVDALSRAFATGFLVAALLTTIYSMHLRDSMQQAMGLIYASTAVGGALAGDLLTLFVFWELAGLSSVFLIWARRSDRSYRAGMRYLVAQVISGLVLLAGIVLHVRAGNGLEFSYIGLDSTAGVLILLAVGVKCAFPVLHVWLQDTYPEATIVGTVALSAFTTKFAVYVLARAFPGTELLVWLGAIMTFFPIFYAVIENDLRRVLSYSMINQLGFMVVGIGVGGSLGINGATAHAIADMVFKGLLFMSMGAVLLRTGTVNGSDLGGLYKSMPQTMVLCVVGAASISALPLFSGFITKSMILQSAAEEHRTVIWLLLLFASAGVLYKAGIKVPYFAFFARDRGYRVAEAPLNMRVAMGLAAVVCVAIGVAPDLLYGILPHTTDYAAYTTPHVVNQAQVLLLAAFVFAVLVRTGVYPPERRGVNLDLDVVYRRFLPYTWDAAVAGTTRLREGVTPTVTHAARAVWRSTSAPLRQDGRVAVPWTTHLMVWWVALLLGVVLLIALL